MREFVAILVLTCSFFHVVEVKVETTYVGCYVLNDKNISLFYEPTIAGASNTVGECVASCVDKYYRYAALRNSEKCFCVSSLEDGSEVKAECNKPCHGNSSQFCGGIKASAVYDTGQKVSGPPETLEIVNILNTSIEVSWTPPKAANGEISSYTVSVSPNHTYAISSVLQPVVLTYQGTSTRADIVSLHPGTEYKIAVAAVTSAGFGVPRTASTRTQIGVPNEPSAPEIISRQHGKIKIHLSPAVNENGPISMYRIVVLEGNNFVFDVNWLKSYDVAQTEGTPYYIAAEIKPEALPAEFIVGDNKTYWGYYNPPIPETVDVHITLGVVSSVNGTTYASYAQVTHEQHNGILILNVEGKVVDDESPPGLIVALSVAIGIFGFLLLLSVAAYFVLRQHFSRRRQGADHQELSLQGPIIEVESNSYIHNGYMPEEEEEERPNHYEKLKQLVWNIPRNFLDVSTEVLGSGSYGHVVKGTVQQRGFPVPVAIHTIDDVSLDGPLRRNMLKDLDVLIRVGTNMNVIHLVGLCETPDILYVVLEHHPASLKDILLESRQQGQAKPRICSLPEHHIIEIMIGVTHAMDHLTSKKILHKQLCSRNILMADGMIPKVCGFGIVQYTKKDIVPDYTRWTAQEIFRGRHFVSKSDVWSFGVTLWEITALGGTPYADVSTKDLPARVMRGLRLPQLPVVSDDLYQLMLQCWQLDLDERPTFSEVVFILKNILEDPLIHLTFSSNAGVHYQQYSPDLEVQT